MNANLKAILVKMDVNQEKTRNTFYVKDGNQYLSVCENCTKCKKGKDKDKRVICRSNLQPKVGMVRCIQFEQKL